MEDFEAVVMAGMDVVVVEVILAEMVVTEIKPVVLMVEVDHIIRVSS